MKYNSIGEQLVAKAKELDPSYKPDKFNDMSEALDVILNNTGGGSGGGKSVPPTLNLVNFGSENPIRTTITEEEKTNLENGLYNQIIYAAVSSETDIISSAFPSKLMAVNGQYAFTQFKTINDANGVLSSFIYQYSIGIGEKNASNEYPITVEKQMDIPIGNDSFVIVTFED